MRPAIPQAARVHATFLSAVVALVLLLGSATGIAALQTPFPNAGTSGDPGFLFESPRISIGIRGGMFLHRAGSDLYDFTTERFTVDRSDYRAVAVGLEGAVWLGNRAEIVVGVDGSRLTLRSEYRDWMEEVDGPDGELIELPIRQVTRLSHGPAVSAGVRWYLMDRGERLGRFVWIPRSWNAWVGGGGGLLAYELVLDGDFVNEVDESVVTDEYRSSGNTPFPFLSGGVEFSLSTRAALSIEGRYQWGSHELGPDFQQDFVHPLDLAGTRLSAGLHYRF